MRCWRFSLRRQFVPYLEGELPRRAARRLERHLDECAFCRAAFVRLRAGHQLAQQIRRLSPKDARRPPEFEAMTADADSIPARRRGWARAAEAWLDLVSTPRLVQVLMALVLVLAALLVVSNRRFLFGERTVVAAKSSALDFSKFRPLSIPELPSNTQPHIATEGYVRDVRLDKDEGTLHFKLTEAPQGPGPFVVCEIMGQIGTALPREGNRVRVYGVARYDAQPGREWHEVNPVLNIAVLRH